MQTISHFFELWKSRPHGQCILTIYILETLQKLLNKNKNKNLIKEKTIGNTGTIRKTSAHRWYCLSPIASCIVWCFSFFKGKSIILSRRRRRKRGRRREKVDT